MSRRQRTWDNYEDETVRSYVKEMVQLTDLLVGQALVLADTLDGGAVKSATPRRRVSVQSTADTDSPHERSLAELDELVSRLRVTVGELFGVRAE